MNLFQKCDIVLHSGGKSDFKIECDTLTNEDWNTLAYLISKKYSFKETHGVPIGGLRLERALKQYRDKNSKTILVVDDVMTTGNSMRKMRDKLILDYDYSANDVVGVVVFKRGFTPIPVWIVPIFRMW